MMNLRCATLAFRFSLALLALLMLGVTTGCKGMIPEFGTPAHAILRGQPLDPPPPKNLRWIRFLSANVPDNTRESRTWGKSDGKLPNVYALLFLNDKEVLRTSVQAQTLAPTWSDSPRGNIKIMRKDMFRAELWDANPLSDTAIGIREFERLTEEQLSEKELQIKFGGGADLTIALEPAHAIRGAGLRYQLRNASCYITRTLEGSPARSAGIKPGDEVLRIGDRETKTMPAVEIKRAFNAIPSTGLPLMVKHAKGAVLSLTLNEGLFYPLYEEFGSLN